MYWGLGNWRVILRLENMQRRVTKIIKGAENYSYRERLEKLILTTLLERRMRADLNETFKIINGISNYGRYFFRISSQTWNLLTRQISKIKSTNQLDFFANRVIYFWNKLPNQIKNSNSVENFKIKWNGFWNNGKKKNLGGNFWELPGTLLNRIIFALIDIVLIVYIFCVKIPFFFKRLMWESDKKVRCLRRHNK